MSDEENEVAEVVLTTTTYCNPNPNRGPGGPGSRSKNFCFTLNNWAVGDTQYLRDELVCEYLVFGREGAKLGHTPHLQGQVVFKSQKTRSAVSKLLGPRYHIECTASLFKSIEYCKKEGDFFEKGTMPACQEAKGNKEKERWAAILAAAQLGRFEEICPKIQVLHGKNLDHVYSRALRAKKLAPTFKQMKWYFGATGTGKSRKAREDNPDAYIKMLNKWWDGYTDQPVVIIEDVDPVMCERMAHWFKIWTDHYPFPCEIKGTVIQVRPETIIVTSNYSLEQCFPAQQDQEALERRFEITEFRPNRLPRVLAAKVRGTPAETYFNHPQDVTEEEATMMTPKMEIVQGLGDPKEASDSDDARCFDAFCDDGLSKHPYWNQDERESWEYLCHVRHQNYKDWKETGLGAPHQMFPMTQHREIKRRKRDEAFGCAPTQPLPEEVIEVSEDDTEE